MVRKKQQFCRNGHDKYITGITPDGRCKICRLDYNRKLSKRLARAGIYKILNIINGKFYIGSSLNLTKRWGQHLFDFRHNEHDSPILQRAWNKYGEEAFKFEVIEEILDISKLIEREQYWMDYYQSYERDKGYNICRKADSPIGIKRTEENKQKISETLKRKNALGLIINGFKGKHHTVETKEISSQKIKTWYADPGNQEFMKVRLSNPETRKKKLVAIQKALAVKMELQNMSKK